MNHQTDNRKDVRGGKSEVEGKGEGQGEVGDIGRVRIKVSVGMGDLDVLYIGEENDDNHHIWPIYSGKPFHFKYPFSSFDTLDLICRFCPQRDN